MSHGLRQHRLTRARGSVQKNAAWGINADLGIQVVVSQRQLNSLTDFLLLLVTAANTTTRPGKCDVRVPRWERVQIERACR